MNNNTVQIKSKRFAVRIVRMFQYLTEHHCPYVLAKQVLRSGTSIGANIAEAECAVTKKDFASKMYIAFKECSETKYWLELLYETKYLTKEMFDSMTEDCSDLFYMLSAITRTARESGKA